jgi:hypothetical protein
VKSETAARAVHARGTNPWNWLNRACCCRKLQLAGLVQGEMHALMTAILLRLPE